MQGNLYFHRKGTASFLSAKYAVAAAMLEMPLEKGGGGRDYAEQIRNRLRQLRQTRSRPVSAESRSHHFMPRMS